MTFTEFLSLPEMLRGWGKYIRSLLPKRVKPPEPSPWQFTLRVSDGSVHSGLSDTDCKALIQRLLEEKDVEIKVTAQRAETPDGRLMRLEREREYARDLKEARIQVEAFCK